MSMLFYIHCSLIYYGEQALSLELLEQFNHFWNIRQFDSHLTVDPDSVSRLIGAVPNCLHYNCHRTMWYKNNQSDHIFSQFEWTFLLPLSLLFVLIFHTLSYLLPSVSQWPVAERPLLLLFWQHCFLRNKQKKTGNKMETMCYSRC